MIDQNHDLWRLVLESSWPPRRDKMRYDSDWLLWVCDLCRRIRGIPSIFG